MWSARTWIYYSILKDVAESINVALKEKVHYKEPASFIEHTNSLLNSRRKWWGPEMEHYGVSTQTWLAGPSQFSVSAL